MHLNQRRLTRYVVAFTLLWMASCGSERKGIKLYQTDDTDNSQLTTAIAKFFIEKAFGRTVTVTKGSMSDADQALANGAADIVAYAEGPVSNGETMGRFVQVGNIWKGQKYARKEFKKDAIDIAQFLTKMAFDDALDLHDALDWMRRVGATYEQAAIRLLHEKQPTWRGWISPSLEFRIQEALNSEILDMKSRGFNMDA